MMYVLTTVSIVSVQPNPDVSVRIFLRNFNVLYILFSKMGNEIRLITSEKGRDLLVVNGHALRRIRQQAVGYFRCGDPIKISIQQRN